MWPLTFRGQQSSSNPWIYIGPLSSIPELPPSPEGSSDLHPTSTPPDCLILSHCPETHSFTPQLPPEAFPSSPSSAETQILVFRYRSTIHAVDHICPHQSFPLSAGSVYDIEDFGIVLSAGISCPRHGWSFDLNTGRSDRGGYRLKVWEVERRPGEGGGEEGVWVRRKEGRRIG